MPSFMEGDTDGWQTASNPITDNLYLLDRANPSDFTDANGHLSLGEQGVVAAGAAGLLAAGDQFGSVADILTENLVAEARVYEEDVSQLATDTANSAVEEIEADLGEIAHTADNFRKNLENLTGWQPSLTEEFEDLQAHHVFSQEFESPFEEWGIDVHDPMNGQWVGTESDDDHLGNADEYNQLWETFIDNAVQAGITPTVQDLLAEGTRIMNQVYGLDPLYEQ